MTTLIEAMKQALNALEDIFGKNKVDVGAINALRAAIAEAEKRGPSYYGLTNDHLWMSVSKEQYGKLKPAFRMACYTTPPAAPAAQRQWVGLTDEQKSLDNAPPQFDRSQASAWQDGVYWAEAKLKEKNT
jgi:hypothetical protein